MLADTQLCTDGKPPDDRRYSRLNILFLITSMLTFIPWMIDHTRKGIIAILIQVLCD